jgi:hypothetical protein
MRKVGHATSNRRTGLPRHGSPLQQDAAAPTVMSAGPGCDFSRVPVHDPGSAQVHVSRAPAYLTPTAPTDPHERAADLVAGDWAAGSAEVPGARSPPVRSGGHRGSPPDADQHPRRPRRAGLAARTGAPSRHGTVVRSGPVRHPSARGRAGRAVDAGNAGPSLPRRTGRRLPPRPVRTSHPPWPGTHRPRGGAHDRPGRVRGQTAGPPAGSGARSRGPGQTDVALPRGRDRGRGRTPLLACRPTAGGPVPQLRCLVADRRPPGSGGRHPRMDEGAGGLGGRRWTAGRTAR